MFAKVVIGLVLACASLGAFNAKPFGPLECRPPCSHQYEPVCATDGKTFEEFENKCHYNCRFDEFESLVPTTLDRCNNELEHSYRRMHFKLNYLYFTKAGCNGTCTVPDRPLCISNGFLRFMVSPCLMNVMNCIMGNKDTFKIIKNGTCPRRSGF